MDESLICRNCKVAAQGVHRDGEVVRISCPSCGVFLEGDAARQMHREQGRYFAIKKAQDIVSKGIRGSKFIRHRKAAISDPGGPFIIGEPKS